MKTEKAYLAAGCFWGPEEEYRKMPGVIETAVGYAGGHTENPTYEEVCEGKTGHAETVEIEFDPEKISFKEILEKFWEIHDPTEPNRLGNNTANQYRSIIFYTNEEQEKTAEESKQEKDAEEKFSAPIATEILPIKPGEFYLAEEYHQKYLFKKGANTC